MQANAADAAAAQVVAHLGALPLHYKSFYGARLVARLQQELGTAGLAAVGQADGAAGQPPLQDARGHRDEAAGVAGGRVQPCAGSGKMTDLEQSRAGDDAKRCATM